MLRISATAWLSRWRTPAKSFVARIRRRVAGRGFSRLALARLPEHAAALVDLLVERLGPLDPPVGVRAGVAQPGADLAQQLADSVIDDVDLVGGAAVRSGGQTSRLTSMPTATPIPTSSKRAASMPPSSL